MEEAEDSSLMNPSTVKQPLVRKQKILPQSILNKEAEDSSLVDHTSTLLLSKSIPTTPQ